VLGALPHWEWLLPHERMTDALAIIAHRRGTRMDEESGVDRMTGIIFGLIVQKVRHTLVLVLSGTATRRAC
jgi:hypothetical protein